MKISSGTIGMESARTYQATRLSVTGFSVNTYGKEKEAAKEKYGKMNETLISPKEWQRRMGAHKTRVLDASQESPSIASDLRQVTIRYIFELLFGKRKERLQDYQLVEESFEPQAEAATRLEWFSESETTQFSSQGTVTCEDGRTINFDVSVSMSRSVQKYIKEDFATGVQMCDPLVISLSDCPISLQSEKMFFDLDCDGVEDRIAKLGVGNGYLALDKNKDGIINDGSELFGTKSNDGFRDLAAYDLDHNGWIDENDAIFDKLKIWCMEPNGEMKLYSLKEKNIGAISLMNVENDFSMETVSSEKLGQIRRMGIFLYENGYSGTMAHVDLVKD